MLHRIVSKKSLPPFIIWSLNPTVFIVDGGQRVVYGTDDGVYLSDLREPRQEPVKVLALVDVAQVDVLDDYQLLIVLSGESHCLFLTYAGLTLDFRTTSYHIPSRCSGSTRPRGGFETSETDIITYIVLQSRFLLRPSPRLHCQVEPAFEYVQDPGAN